MTKHFSTIAACATALEKKELTAVEVAEHFLKVIQEKNQLGAYLDVFMEGAIADAQRADEARKAGKNGVLCGIPFAIKDNILIHDQSSTAASHILTGFIAPYDATVIRKLREAHAVFLGRTNMDEFAMGSSTEQSAWQETKNPHDESRVPGGSSGGSACAVAAGMALGALGSDTGGSIRQPASFCGVVGLKPTYGRVSRHGLIAMASSLDQIGPLACTVEDTKLLFEAIEGQDLFDSTSRKAPETTKKFNLKKLRIGLPKEYFAEGLAPEVKERVLAAASALEKGGAILQDVSLPSTPWALACYYVLMPAEASTNLARYDGIRYGYSAEETGLERVYTTSRSEGFGDEVRRRIILGTFVLSSGYKDAYYRRAFEKRVFIREDFRKVFEKVDVLLTPTAPTPAFKMGERSQDPLSMYLADIYTVSASLAGIPALSLPYGAVEREGKKLPVGVQLMAPWFGENFLFEVGNFLEKTFS